MSDDPPTPEERDWAPTVTGAQKLRVGLLGANAWLVVYFIPTLHLGLGSYGQNALALMPLVVLALGVGWLTEHRERARWCLLAIYPPALGASIAVRTDLVERGIFDELVILVGLASLIAHVAAAAHACSRPPSQKHSTSHPLMAKAPVVEPRARRFLRRALLAIAAVGGFAVVGVAPSWTGRAERTERWGEAADDGAVLTIVVAAVTAAFALGAIVGPALRAERRPNLTPARRRRRVTVAILVGTTAGISWLILSHFDQAS